jgi:hypothetical protein
MRYPDAIGFAVLKLNGMKVRITEFKLKKISGGSDKTDFSNVASTAIIFPRPGRYVIVPFTSQKLTQSKDYILHCTFGDGCIEFEVNDVITERLMDQVVSDDDEEDDEDNDDYDEEMDEEQDDQKVFKPLKPSRYDKVPPPKLYLRPSWEYSESTEERGIVSVYDEVGDLCKYMDTIRNEIRNIRISMMELKELGQEITSQKVEMNKITDEKVTNKPQLMKYTLNTENKLILEVEPKNIDTSNIPHIKIDKDTYKLIGSNLEIDITLYYFDLNPENLFYYAYLITDI